MFETKNLTSEIAKKAQVGNTGEFMKISQGSDFCILTKKYADSYLNRIKAFKVFDDDIWLISFPKTGSNWTKKVILDIESNFDLEKVTKSFVYLEYNSINQNVIEDYCDRAQKMPRPRFIKSHLPIFLLPDELWTVKPKIVYVARNPKDVAVSYFHHHVHVQKGEVNLEDFLEAFTTNQMLYSPFNDHVLEFWKIRDQKNFLFLFYEDMKRDFDGAVKKLANFLEKSPTQDQVDKTCDKYSFENMRLNPKINMRKLCTEKYSFLRKGKVGSYKEELTEEQNKKLDEFMKYEDFEKFGFGFDF